MAIPVLDAEAFQFAKRRADFESRGVFPAVNSLACLNDAHDKHRAFEVCRQAGITQPERFDSPDAAAPNAFPLIGKPLFGDGSKGLLVLEEPQSPLLPGIDVSSYIWQQYIRGKEYSIDTFGAPASPYYVAVPRYRRLVRDGQMVQGYTDDDPSLIDFACRICTAFGTSDIGCIQAIRDDNGDLFFIEINPRYGAGISLSLEAGVNFPHLQWLAHAAPEAITPEMTRFRPGVEMLRYWDAVFRMRTETE
jgi:carbamoyl-phosphate synthase large subunit